jgi:hypothetical protein
VVEHGVDEFPDVVVGEGVVDVLSVASSRDDAAVAQRPEPLGHGRLVGARCGDEFSDAGFALGDQLDEGEARRVGEGLQEFGSPTHGVGVTADRTDAVVIVRCVQENHRFNISSNDEVCNAVRAVSVVGTARAQHDVVDVV